MSKRTQPLVHTRITRIYPDFQPQKTNPIQTQFKALARSNGSTRRTTKTPRALTAILFTLFQTLLKNNIDPQKWLFAYFEACAQNGGRVPTNLDEFLPWNLSEPQKATWHYSEQPP